MKSKKRIQLVVLTFGMIVGSPLYAAETLGSIVDKVLTQTPDLRSAQANLESAQSDYRTIQSLRYPRLSVRSAFVRGDNPVYVFGSLLEQQSFEAKNFALDSLNNPDSLTNIKNSLDVGVPLFTAFELKHGAQVRKLAMSQAQQRIMAADQHVRLQAIDAYLSVLLKQMNLDAVSERIRFATNEIEEARKLNSKGLILGSDFFAAQAILSSLNVQRIQSEKELEKTHQRLSVLTSETTEKWELVGALSSSDYPVGNKTDVLNQALLSRPEIKDADLDIQISETNAVQASRSFLPTIEAFASLETNTEDFRSNPTNHTFGVRSDFPIGDPAYLSRKSKAKAIESGARDQKDRTTEMIRLDIIDALTQYENARDSLVPLKQSMDQAAKSLDLTRPLYREGRQSIVDVLRAEDLLLKVQQQLIGDLYQLHLGYARLALAMGTLDRSTVEQIQKRLESKP